jgi:indole-3-glycerol phosphate synthase
MSIPTIMTGTILDRILERTAADLAERRKLASIGDLERRCVEQAAPVSLCGALSGPGMRLIAEIKRASPSKGVFPVEVRPAEVAREYLAGGAAAISCLTDAPYFQGSLADLEASAASAHDRPRPAPVLRKDFVVDAYQIVEGRACGADAVLLIVAALEDGALRDLLATARGHGMDALVEVHDEPELERAVVAGADVIGINNRDLRTFEVDLAVAERLAPLAPPGAIVVGESGIFTRHDVERLERAGIDAVLVGESLIVAPDRTAAVRELLGEAER